MHGKFQIDKEIHDVERLTMRMYKNQNRDIPAISNSITMIH